MKKQLFNMFLVFVLGLSSAHVTFAMLGPDENPNDLANRLWDQVAAAEKEQANRRGNIATCEGMRLLKADTDLVRINLGLYIAKNQLIVDKLQREINHRNDLLAILEDNSDALLSRDQNVRADKRQTFNGFAAQEANDLQAAVNELEARIARIDQGIEQQNVEAKRTVLAEVTGVPQNNNPPPANGGKKDDAKANIKNTPVVSDNGTKKLFSPRYITAAAIVGAAVATVYFHGKRIKRWITSKLERRAKPAVKRNR